MLFRSTTFISFVSQSRYKAQEQQGNYDVVLQKQIENVELATKAELAAKNKSAKEIKVVETNAVERSKQKAKEILEDDRALIQARIILSKAGSDERLKAEIDLIQKEKEIKLKDSSTSPAQKALIEIEAQKQITEKKVEFTQREIAAQIKLNDNVCCHNYFICL